MTGGSEGVARHVCNALDLPVAHVLTGAQIAIMSDEALAANLERTKLFCRVSPPQKLRTLSALRREGHVLPMLPTQILLNNLLYDMSETAIPLDRVDSETLLHPQRWDRDAIRKFTFLFGPISSLFDFATFYIVLHVFHADEIQFHTACFVESIATRALVIFVIRTATPFRSFPHPVLATASLGVVAMALLLPYMPAAHWLGFAAMPANLVALLGAVTAIYLVTVYWVRRWFFVRHGLV